MRPHCHYCKGYRVTRLVREATFFYLRPTSDGFHADARCEEHKLGPNSEHVSLQEYLVAQVMLS